MATPVARALFASLFLASACAGNVGSTSSSGGAGGSSAVGATGGRSTAAGATGASAGAAGEARPANVRCVGPCANEGPRPEPLPRPVCPELEPQNGAACAESGLECSYGDSSSAACRRIYDCVLDGAAATWVVNAALQEAYPCQPLPDGYCPDAPPEQLSACTLAVFNTPCVYGSLLCYCALGGSGTNTAGTPGIWGCAGPPSDLSCPAKLPNIGEGCASSGTECDYGDGCVDPATANVFCHDGAWELGTPFNCHGK